ncbi:MAG TPA: UbiA family prenyltransferase [Gemmataceae bacterium]|nr:UbiA family prenyltransferase [Gemmataceae bacterium]
MDRLRPYFQLVRLPNVFTALADIALAALATWAVQDQPLGRHLPAFLLLCLASACLYCGGMVWNDFFDVEQDRHERPFRPIPSGRVSLRTAGLLGGVLLAAGTLFAILSALTHAAGGRAAPIVIALLLAGAILAYDGWLKRSGMGPVAMGACRFLNVLLGLTVAGTPIDRWGWLLALVVGLYIAGVTWFARTEARVSNQTALGGAAAVMLAALLLAVPVPALSPAGSASPLFPYLLVVLGFLVGIPASKAIAGPTPGNVQAAVKRSLMGLVVLDAVLATAVAGTVGLAVLVLLVPILYLGRWRWLYAT